MKNMHKKTYTILLGSLLTLGAAFQLAAQAPRKSPHEKVSATINGKTITIEYGRPYMKGRKIFGGLEPLGKVWRTGADEATTLASDADLDIKGLKVSKGTYALFTLPGESEWKLIVNKTAKQWGAFKYEESADLGRVAMDVKKTGAPVEQFTIKLESTGGNKGKLTLEWENTSASVPFTVH